MKTKSLLFILILFVGLIGFNACQKDDEAPAPLTKEEADVALSESDGQFVAISGEIGENEGYNVQSYIDDLDLPFYGQPVKASKFVKYNNKELKGIVEKFTANNKSRDFDFNFGFIYALYDVYDVSEIFGTWDYTDGSFVKSSTTPSNGIILNFPYPYDNTSNNARLTYSDFKLLEGEVLSFKGKVEVDDVSVFTFSLTTKYSFTEFTQTLITSFGDFEFSLVSYMTFNQDYFIYKYTNTLKKLDKVVYKEYSKIKVDSETEDVTIEAAQTIGKLEFRFKLKSINGTFENFYQTPNDYLTMSLYTTGDAKIGDFVYVYNVEQQNWDLYFEYTDGTQVALNSLELSLEYRLWGFFEWLLWGDYED